MHRYRALPVVPNNSQFDVITTFFSVEYACKSEEEYSAAISNICRMVRSGGHFIMGGVMEDSWYEFGGKRFACLHLRKAVLFSSLTTAGIDLENDFVYCNHEGIFLVHDRKV